LSKRQRYKHIPWGVEAAALLEEVVLEDYRKFRIYNSQMILLRIVRQSNPLNLGKLFVVCSLYQLGKRLHQYLPAVQVDWEMNLAVVRPLEVGLDWRCSDNRYNPVRILLGLQS
jgi:hypothetical protein